MKELVETFEGKSIRRVWLNDRWYFSVVDIIEVLMETPNPRSYWKVLKHRLLKEGSQVVTNCNQLKMPAADGKNYKLSSSREMKKIEGK